MLSHTCGAVLGVDGWLEARLPVDEDGLANQDAVHLRHGRRVRLNLQSLLISPSKELKNVSPLKGQFTDYLVLSLYDQSMYD